jgi:hypothetical protein
MLNVLWLQSGGCGGCSMSLLCADTADFAACCAAAGMRTAVAPVAVAGQRRRGRWRCWTTAAPAACRWTCCASKARCCAARRAAGASTCWPAPAEPMMDWVRDLAGVARHVVAVGSCAAWGGITATGANATDACGLQYEDDRPAACSAPLRARGGCRWSTWPAAPRTRAG